MAKELTVNQLMIMMDLYRGTNTQRYIVTKPKDMQVLKKLQLCEPNNTLTKAGKAYVEGCKALLSGNLPIIDTVQEQQKEEEEETIIELLKEVKSLGLHLYNPMSASYGVGMKVKRKIEELEP